MRFGFVEFREHLDALQTLRALSNQPLPGYKKSGVQITFSVEDQRKLHIRFISLIRKLKLEHQAALVEYHICVDMKLPKQFTVACNAQPSAFAYPEPLKEKVAASRSQPSELAEFYSSDGL